MPNFQMPFDPTMQPSSIPLSMAPQGMYGNQSFMSPAVQQGLQAPAMTMPQDERSNLDAYRIMAQGIQGMGRGMQQPMPSGNTAQIMRDQSRPQFAGYVGSPQQQMAMALRNRG